jgi:hypothetical protein
MATLVEDMPASAGVHPCTTSIDSQTSDAQPVAAKEYAFNNLVTVVMCTLITTSLHYVCGSVQTYTTNTAWHWLANLQE